MNTSLRVLRPTRVPETTTRNRMGANARLREATVATQRAETRREVAGRFAAFAPRIGLILALVGVLAGSVAGLRMLALSRGWIALREVQVTGFSAVPFQEVVGLAKLPGGAPLTDVDLAGIRSRLLAHPWIAEASVRRSFPHRIAIVVRERIPSMALPDGRWVAPDGRVMDPRGARALPVVSGIRDDGRTVEPAALAAAASMAEIASSAPTLRGRLRDLAMERDGTISLRLDGFPPLLRVRPDEWKKAFARADVLERELTTESGAIGEIDLRYGSCAALRRREGGA